jgi:hypothetical protein
MLFFLMTETTQPLISNKKLLANNKKIFLKCQENNS